MAAACVGLALAGCGGHASVPAVAVPSVPSRCAAVSASPPVSLTEVHQGGGTVELAPVCIDGHGPYPFEVDTGAAQSVLDAGLAATLHLPADPQRPEAVGIGCAALRRLVTVGTWSLGAIPLAGQQVLVTPNGWFGRQGRPDGLIGSDVLSRFGAVRIDFRRARLTVLAPEGAAPTHASVLTGTGSQPPPPLLVHGTPQAVADLTVLRFGGTAEATAATALGGGRPVPFVVDTGSWGSSVAPTLATSASLRPTGGRVAAPGVACSGTVATVGSGNWQTGTTPLGARPLAVVPLAGGTQQGVEGTLGTDVLSGYGSVVLDYRTALLWLGAG